MEQINRPAVIAAMVPEKIVELDVSPILRSGGEPFGAIMGAVGQVVQDGALRLLTTFNPTPLYAVLGKQGFQHWIERGEGDDWVVWFYHGGKDEETKPSQAEMRGAFLLRDRPELQGRLSITDDRWELDVRGLSPPEPMELTLAVVEKLPKAVALVQINERVPQFLFPLLEERGCTYRITDSGEIVRTEIQRTGNNLS